ncbi:Lactonase, 7-bladed beta-propeller-domain-containing protein [Ephemerocybe angulata]|uniref:Lactonase, 7-bladed beta-propeller-domain-containing protein n=1 Tax=Ephemerocybe angulata TaxID=980116 RepID=A0A8H6HW09_9AGAR|nr:Lactonase, 7-bladed beta-propeller-domain-containing protein [Tulosesus angulatus]
MVSWKILAGGYDYFIATYLLTVNGESADLRLVSRSPSGRNPSWLTPHPFNKNLVYATNEYGPYGGVQSYQVSDSGSVSVVDTISSLGADPAHAVALPNGKVVVMNYSSGDGRIITTTDGGRRFLNDSSAHYLKFQAPAGGVSHPHQTVQRGETLFIPDLGADKIWRIQEEGDSVVVKDYLPQPQGSGPRHIALSEDRLFTLHELSSTLSVQPLTSFNQPSTEIASVSIVPKDAPAGAKWSAGEILIPEPTPKSPKSYIYTSNRNLGNTDPRGDTIAIFELVNKGTSSEALVLVNQVYTGLSQVRGMEFGPAENGGDEYLIASGVAGGAGVVVLKKVDGGRNLEIVAKNDEIPTRTSFLWL